jgi:hypothetical protein
MLFTFCSRDATGLAPIEIGASIDTSAAADFRRKVTTPRHRGKTEIFPESRSLGTGQAPIAIGTGPDSDRDRLYQRLRPSLASHIGRNPSLFGRQAIPFREEIPDLRHPTRIRRGLVSFMVKNTHLEFFIIPRYLHIYHPISKKYSGKFAQTNNCIYISNYLVAYLDYENKKRCISSYS